VETSYLNTDMCKLESSQKGAEPCRMIPRKLAAKLELLTVIQICSILFFVPSMHVTMSSRV